MPPDDCKADPAVTGCDFLQGFHQLYMVLLRNTSAMSQSLSCDICSVLHMKMQELHQRVGVFLWRRAESELEEDDS